MSAHMTWSVGREDDLVTLIADSPDNPRESWLRLRLDSDGSFTEKDFTVEKARALWWALGQACDLVEAQQDIL